MRESNLHLFVAISNLNRGESVFVLDALVRSCIRHHIRQHTSAYVRIRQHSWAYVSIRQHTSEFVSIRQHTAYLCLMHLCAAGTGLIRRMLRSWKHLRRQECGWCPSSRLWVVPLSRLVCLVCSVPHIVLVGSVPCTSSLPHVPPNVCLLCSVPCPSSLPHVRPKPSAF